MAMIELRTYGSTGPMVLVLHGGPGAPGYMAPVARELADSFRVIEPYQRRSGDEPLTVARHIEDLHDVLNARCHDELAALVGSSWGAMLALAYAAAHPERACPIALIGCGTFDLASRAQLEATLRERMSKELRQQLGVKLRTTNDRDERLRLIGELTLPLYACDIITQDLEVEAHDGRAHEETWNDMLRLQTEGVYPASFAAITSPVLMLHGAADPHPGRMIRSSLMPYLPQIEYVEWERCGHYPWLEKSARIEFFAKLRGWLMGQMTT
jgi:pimeloyl-ACP methyl ester carboxylesterase